MRGVIAYTELLLNQFGHTRHRPEIGRVPNAQRAAGQELHQSPLLRGGQPRRTSRGGFGLSRRLLRSPAPRSTAER
jgi:hypothetical protein